MGTKGVEMKKLLKTVLILAVIAVALFALLAFLEDVYHRTPPEKETFAQRTLALNEDEVREETAETEETADSQEDVEKIVRNIAGDHKTFQEYFSEIETFQNEGVPEEAAHPAVKYAEGSWVYDMTFYFEGQDGYFFEEIGYAEFVIDYEKEVLIIELHPRMANDGYEAWEESDEDVGYEPFTGGFNDDGSLGLSGNDAVINISEYFAYEGREYMMGTLWISEEDYATFNMIRGQE